MASNPMAWMPHGVGRRARARLQFEALDERAMLAVAGFEFHLYADAGGAPGEPIAADAVPVGDRFFVEITAQDLRTDAAGLAGHAPGIRGLALDVSWDPDVLEVVADPFDPAAGIVTERFPLFRGGTLDNEAGRIDELQGAMSHASASGQTIGGLGPERFALLEFRALAAVESTALSMNLGAGQISLFPSVPLVRGSDFAFETQSIAVVEPSDTGGAAQVTGAAQQQVDVNIYQGPAAEAARRIDASALDINRSFSVDVILPPARQERASDRGAPGHVDVAALEPFASGRVTPAAGELLLTRLVTDVQGVAVDLPLAIGPLDETTFAVATTRRFTISYQPPPGVATAADAALAAASSDELSTAAGRSPDRALLQAIASSLASTLAEEEADDPTRNNPI